MLKSQKKLKSTFVRGLIGEKFRKVYFNDMSGIVRKNMGEKGGNGMG